MMRKAAIDMVWGRILRGGKHGVAIESKHLIGSSGGGVVMKRNVQRGFQVSPGTA